MTSGGDPGAATAVAASPGVPMVRRRKRAPEASEPPPEEPRRAGTGRRPRRRSSRRPSCRRSSRRAELTRRAAAPSRPPSRPSPSTPARMSPNPAAGGGRALGPDARQRPGRQLARPARAQPAPLVADHRPAVRRGRLRRRAWAQPRPRPGHPLLPRSVPPAHPRRRPERRCPPSERRSTRFAIALTNLPLLALLVLLGGAAAGVALLLTVGAALAYSVPPIRTRARPILDAVTRAMLVVLPAVCGSLVAGLAVAEPALAGARSPSRPGRWPRRRSAPSRSVTARPGGRARDRSRPRSAGARRRPCRSSATPWPRSPGLARIARACSRRSGWPSTSCCRRWSSWRRARTPAAMEACRPTRLDRPPRAALRGGCLARDPAPAPLGPRRRRQQPGARDRRLSRRDRVRGLEHRDDADRHPAAAHPSGRRARDPPDDHRRREPRRRGAARGLRRGHARADLCGHGDPRRRHGLDGRLAGARGGDPRRRRVRHRGAARRPMDGPRGTGHAGPGSRQSQGDLVLFLDVDTLLVPVAARIIVEQLEERRWDLLSGLARDEMPTAGERAAVPGFALLRFGFRPIWLAAWTRGRLRAAAFASGSLALVRRDAYLAVGGHAAYPDSRDADIGPRAGARARRSSGGHHVTSPTLPPAATYAGDRRGDPRLASRLSCRTSVARWRSGSWRWWPRRSPTLSRWSSRWSRSSPGRRPGRWSRHSSRCSCSASRGSRWS